MPPLCTKYHQILACGGNYTPKTAIAGYPSSSLARALSLSLGSSSHIETDTTFWLNAYKFHNPTNPPKCCWVKLENHRSLLNLPNITSIWLLLFCTHEIPWVYTMQFHNPPAFWQAGPARTWESVHHQDFRIYKKMGYSIPPAMDNLPSTLNMKYGDYYRYYAPLNSPNISPKFHRNYYEIINPEKLQFHVP